MSANPYILVVGSHKGGTGRTTTALALAWVWGECGVPVTLVDADPIQAASLVALAPSGRCPWKNVTFQRGWPAGGAFSSDRMLVVVDAPSLTEPEAQPVLGSADGVVLTCLADPLSLRTLPAASAAIRRAREHNPRLDLLGLTINLFNPRDELQGQMLARLRQTQGELLLEPPVPCQQEMGEWAMNPGSELPPGPAREAFVAVARTIESLLGITAAT